MKTQNGRAGNCLPWNKGKLTGQKPPLKRIYTPKLQRALHKCGRPSDQERRQRPRAHWYAPAE